MPPDLDSSAWSPSCIFESMAFGHERDRQRRSRRVRWWLVL